jgi:superfamily I DNA/RNA helicase
MQRPHCHQHYAAARLLTRLQSRVPLEPAFQTLSRTDCYLLERLTHSSQLSERELKRGTAAYLNYGLSAFLATPDLLKAAIAATMMSFDFFPTQNFQFVSYNGPLYQPELR